jgi:hypothetical protein
LLIVGGGVAFPTVALAALLAVALPAVPRTAPAAAPLQVRHVLCFAVCGQAE